jgi:Flp pilus assembly protein TadG
MRKKISPDNSGAALVELAIALPMLFVLVLGIADYGLLMNNTTVLEATVRSGAEMVRASPSIGTLPTSLLPASGPEASNPKWVAIPAASCWCPNGTSVSCPTPGSSSPCSQTLGGVSDLRVLQRVSVSATENVSPMLPWSTITSAFPNVFAPTALVRTE